jgi:hypothetical protein
MAQHSEKRVYRVAEVGEVHVKVIPADFSKGYPTGAALFYECLDCGDFVPSFPDLPTGCQCNNIFMDVDAGRMSVKNNASIRLVELRA